MLTPLPLSLPAPVRWGLLACGPLGAAQQESGTSWAWSLGEGGVQVQGTKGHCAQAGKGAERATLEPPGRQRPLRKSQGWAIPGSSRTLQRHQKSGWRCLQSAVREVAIPAWTGPPSVGCRAGLAGLELQWEVRVGRRRRAGWLVSGCCHSEGGGVHLYERGEVRAGRSDLK